MLVVMSVVVVVVALSSQLASVEVVENEPQVEVIVEEEKTEVEIRTENILHSAEFQKEIKALAESRALFEMSLERQDEAVELSERALETYRVSNELANVWKIKQNN